MAEHRSAIHFFCDDGTCTSDSRDKEFSKTAQITLIADGTNVTLRFDRSPFVSGNKLIEIPAGTFVKEKVAGKGGHFKYSVGCSSCSSGNDDADLIIGL